MKSWTHKSTSFEISNLNDVDTEVLIKLEDNHYVTNELQDEALEDLDEEGNIVGIDTIEYLYNSGKVRIYPMRLDLPGKSKQTVTIEFHSEEAESFTRSLLLQPRYSPNHLIKLNAEVQNPHIGQNRTSLEYSQQFANKVYTIKDPSDPKSIILRNMGNIPSSFEWIDCSNSDIIQGVLVPNKGIIEPKTDIHIKFKFVVKQFGRFSFYFKCICDALDLPIGFELKANVFGLDICYEIPPDESVADLAKKTLNRNRSGFQPGPIDQDTQTALMSNTSGRGANDTTSTLKTFQSHKQKKNTAMTQLEFLDLNINEPGNSSFIIKNLSGIPTYFRLRFDRFESPYQAANQNTEKSVGGTSKANSNLLKKSMTKNFSMTTDFSIKGKTKTGGIMARPKLLDDKIEKVAVFSSANGMQATKVKIQKNEAQNHLQNRKGIALVCKPNEGVQLPNSTQNIAVSIYNEISGSFVDKLISEIKGQDPQEFPIKLFIKGSPLIIPVNQVGLDIQQNPPQLNLGGMQLNSAPMVKSFKLENIGTSDLEVDLKIFNIDDLDADRDQFEIKICPPLPGNDAKCQLDYAQTKVSFQLLISVMLGPGILY